MKYFGGSEIVVEMGLNYFYCNILPRLRRIEAESTERTTDYVDEGGAYRPNIMEEPHNIFEPRLSGYRRLGTARLCSGENPLTHPLTKCCM